MIVVFVLGRKAPKIEQFAEYVIRDLRKLRIAKEININY